MLHRQTIARETAMAWVWRRPKEDSQWGADFDRQASHPMRGTEYLDDKRLDPEIYRPLFRSRTGLKKFKSRHCPPIGVTPAVDHVWKDIILSFVPEERIQFLPIRLIARGEICNDFYWPIILDSVYCIDPDRSWITQKLQKGDNLFIFGVAAFVHLPDCLGGLHIARDIRMRDHIVISDALKDALASTGEDSMFYKPEDIVMLDTEIAKAKLAKQNGSH